MLGAKTRGVVGGSELALMKPSSYLINTSRGALLDEAPLSKALEDGKSAALAVDVFEREPLPAGHHFRRLTNVLATPHVGFGPEILVPDVLSGLGQEHHELDTRQQRRERR